MPIIRDKDGVFTDPRERYLPLSRPNSTPDGAATLKPKAEPCAVHGWQEHAEAENADSRYYNEFGAEHARQPSEEEEAEIWRWFGLEMPEEIVSTKTPRKYEARKKNPGQPSAPEPSRLRKLARDAFDLAIGGVIRLLLLGICFVILYRSNKPGRSLIRLSPLRGSP